VAVWMSIAASQFMFRRRFLAEGNTADGLKYRTPFYPAVPIAAFLLCLASCIGIAFDPNQRIALFCGVPFMALCYIIYYARNRKNGGKMSEPVKKASLHVSFSEYEEKKN
ncbi:S-methylmethionine permease, partial [Bacillus licheniformis]|nr:S-methylmethionine permease [Bacillus licheniformis]